MDKLGILVKVGIVLIMLLVIFNNDHIKTNHFVGKLSVTVPKNQKIVGAPHWDGSNLWYSSRKMHPSDSAETYHFNESSTFGIWEGEVILEEQKDAPATDSSAQADAIKNYLNRN